MSVTTAFKHLCLNGSNLTSPVSKVIRELSDKKLKLSENENGLIENGWEKKKIKVYNCKNG